MRVNSGIQLYAGLPALPPFCFFTSSLKSRSSTQTDSHIYLTGFWSRPRPPTGVSDPETKTCLRVFVFACQCQCQCEALVEPGWTYQQRSPRWLFRDAQSAVRPVCPPSFQWSRRVQILRDTSACATPKHARVRHSRPRSGGLSPESNVDQHRSYNVVAMRAPGGL